MPPAIEERKREMRERIKAQRDALPALEHQLASQQVCQRLMAHRTFRDARCLAAYLSFGSELNTVPIVEQALQWGKQVALPRINAQSGELDLHLIASEAELCPGPWGIREPRPNCPLVSREALDLIIVPGLAFDRQGHRLGYGRGFYDRWLSSQNPITMRVSVMFSMQLVETVPTAPHDETIHLLINENESISVYASETN